MLFTAIFYMLYAFFGENINFITSIYAFLLIIWSQLFLINWKKKCSETMIKWDNFNEEYDVENQRKEYKGIIRKSPITEKLEIYYPFYKRLIKFIESILIITPYLILALFINIVFLNLDGTVLKDSSFYIGSFHKFSTYIKESILINLHPIIYAQAIVFLNKKFISLAISTTERENHRVKSNYENTIILKRYIFEFLNNYFCFFYIAFINQDFPLLKSQIKIIYIANGVRRLFVNTILPNLIKLNKPRNHNIDEFINGKMIDKEMLMNQYQSHAVDLYDDYMELVIEFGFLILFAQSFVFGPIAIIILNKLEKYSDLTRFKYQTRRPEFVRKRNIGMWQFILEAQAFLGIFTNLILIMMTSNDNSQIVYLRSILTSTNSDNKVSFNTSFFIFEHGIILLLILIWKIVPTTAYWVDLFLKRRDFKLKSNKWKVLIDGINDKSSDAVQQRGSIIRNSY